jgi:hypothetical protein
MGLLQTIGNIFGGRKEPESISPSQNSTGQSEADRVLEYGIKATLLMLHPQLSMLGIEPKMVPASLPYTSKRSRGYLIGLVGRVMADMPEEHLHLAPHVGESAFDFLFGPSRARELLVQTINESRTRDPEVIAGGIRGEMEADEVLNRKPFPATMGFYLLTNGEADPNEIAPVV